MHLEGLRILDLSRVLAGPYCTAMLADLGAEVIKIEVPGQGDDARHFGPFRNGESLYFSILNRNKKSVCLNLKDPEARQILHDLARRADVLVENFRPGVTARLGVDFDTLHKVNPRLVYASISGFGQDGPFAQRPAYDLIVQAASGLMTITGSPDGPPIRVGESVGDLVAGMFAAWAICAALLRRERTGAGEHLDVAMLDSLLALQVTAVSIYAGSGQAPGRVGNRHPVSTPFDTFDAADGAVVLVAANEPMFARLARMIDRAELIDDPRFASDVERTHNEPALKAIIQSWTSRRTVGEVVQAATAAGVPSSPILDLAEALSTEQAKARELVSAFEHPIAGEVRFVPQPVRFSTGTAAITRSPLLGEHTDVVLRDLLGLDDSRLAQLHARGAV